jgi:hypothetical protein
MAELDPDVVGRSGVDPVTGSVLSQDVRNALMKRATVNSSIFREETIRVQRQRDEIDTQNIAVAKGNQQALLGVNSSIESLRVEIGKLGTGLAGISLLLQQDSASEENRIRTQQEKDRRLVEQEVRIGKENLIEQKIENALLSPVQKLIPKVTDIFSRIGQAIGALFLGWLTNQTVELLDAQQKESVDKVKDIKNNILKHIGIAIGGLFAIKTGFGLIMKTLGTIGKFLGKLVIAPVAPLLSKANPKATPKPGSGLNVRSNIAIGSLMTGLDIVGGEDPGRAIAGATTGMIGSAAAFGVGSLLPIPGSGLISGAFAYSPSVNFGKDIYDKFFGKSETDNRSLKEEKPKEFPKPTIISESAPEAPPTDILATAQPQTPMTPSSPSAKMVSQFEQAWQYRNNPIARGRIEDAWDKMTTEEKQMAMDWAKSKGYNWNEMKLQMPTTTISTAQINVPPKPQQNVGTLPEPKPNVVMLTSSSGQSQQPNVPITSGALTDVPLINSSNPDNFYVLYSQLNYNVVM